jgi:hypothetical protein
VNRRTGPLGSLESRTPIPPSASSATSTHSALALKVDVLQQVRRWRSDTSPPVVASDTVHPGSRHTGYAAPWANCVPYIIKDLIDARHRSALTSPPQGGGAGIRPDEAEALNVE